MPTTTSLTKSPFTALANKYHVSESFIKMMWYIPILLVAAFTVAWYIPITHKYALWMAVENHPVEMLTFIFLMLGCIVGFMLALHLRKKHGDVIAPLFLTVFGIGLFFVAMEEIAWGQQFFNFKTPDAIDKVNLQHEATLHNIEGLQGTSEFFHLFFGLAGISGAIIHIPLFKKIKVPSIIVSWFIVIALVATADLLIDAYSYSKSAQYFMRRLSEVNEMMIGIAGFLYVWLLLRKERGPATAASGDTILQNQKVYRIPNVS